MPNIGAVKRSEKGEHVAKEPDVVRIKREKRERRLESAPSGMTRRRFLTFLGAGSAALAAGSAGAPTMGVPTSGTGGGDAAVIGGIAEAQAAQASRLSFTPIEPTGEDVVVLPAGFKHDVLRKWGDRVTEDADYGYNNDFVAYCPIRSGLWPEQPGRYSVGQPRVPGPQVGRGVRRLRKRDGEEPRADRAGKGRGRRLYLPGSQAGQYLVLRRGRSVQPLNRRHDPHGPHWARGGRGRGAGRG
jgi:hypothetical protein